MFKNMSDKLMSLTVSIFVLSMIAGTIAGIVFIVKGCLLITSVAFLGVLEIIFGILGIGGTFCLSWLATGIPLALVELDEKLDSVDKSILPISDMNNLKNSIKEEITEE